MMRFCSRRAVLALGGSALLCSACGSVLAHTSPVLQAGTTPLASTPGAASPDTTPVVVGSPTVSAAFLDTVLAFYHSPASGLGQALYAGGVASGIDPVFALAFFMHESGFGTRGEAVASRSLGNLRCIPGAACRDDFAWFPSWEAGFTAWYTLISGPLYVGAGLRTVKAIIHRYAPSADGNSEPAYVQAVCSAVSTWRAGTVEVR